ncbi:MAG TPA: GntR family transcriptional regulator [Rhodothermales bacterium]|nr:GntR family transcriptional regulator [Rhodothermales bacterium]
MITIDRDVTTPVYEQLVEQLRYLIASGKYQIEERLPSTRALGEQIGVSFHTVRKAYQELEQEGLLSSRVGSGFRVKERAPLAKGERIERGATIMQDAIQKLVGLGLDGLEIDHLMQEQLALLDEPHSGPKIVFAAPFQEMADLCAEQVARHLQHPIEPATLVTLLRHQDAEIVLVRMMDLREANSQMPRSDTLGVITYLTPGALESVARMLPQETLAIVTRYADAIQPMMTEIRAQTGFAGQMLATSIEDGTGQLVHLINQADLLLYTPPCRRRLLSMLDDDQKHTAIAPVISATSLAHLRQVVPV